MAETFEPGGQRLLFSGGPLIQRVGYFSRCSAHAKMYVRASSPRFVHLHLLSGHA